MSDSLAAHKPPAEPHKKEPDSNRRSIPAWWSIVALIMAALVVVPILYANLNTKKEPREVEAKAEAAPPMKQEAAAETKAAPSEAQSKAGAAATAPAAKEDGRAPEKPLERFAAVGKEQRKADAAGAAPTPKEEAAPATARATPEPTGAQAKGEAPAAAAPAPQEAATAKEAAAQDRTPVADAATQAKQIGQTAAPLQPVALPKTPAEKQKIDNTLIFRVDGKDKQGRAASFDFVILSNGLTWGAGSTRQVVSGGKTVPEAEAVNRIFTPKVREALAEQTDLIGVGLASSDGKRPDEEARAVARSKTVAAWMAKIAKPQTVLWALTLGQYDKGCKLKEDKEASFERPILVAGVRSKADGVNLQEALGDALSGHDNLPGRECYSRFDMVKIR